MSTHNQENKTLIKKKKGKLSKNEYSKINFLFTRWKNWLYYITISYVFVIFIWSDAKPIIENFFSFIVEFTERNSTNTSAVRAFLRVPTTFFTFLFKGMIFCADGIVSSWLKSPFGQITYFINKSNVESWKGDEVVKILTEINENFKEAFKKFGAGTITREFVKAAEIMFLSYLEASSRNNNFFKNKSFRNLVLLGFETRNIFTFLVEYSLIVPLCFAIWRTEKVARKLIENLEFEND